MVVKPPIRFQVCTACGWTEEQGHRWDRRRQVYRSFWRSTSCPQCGGTLAQACPTCQADIEQVGVEACPRCGTAYPWPVKAQA